MFSSFMISKKTADFHEIYYENYASGCHPKLSIFHFPQAIIKTYRRFEVLR
jgi:hypothetical protein